MARSGFEVVKVPLIILPYSCQSVVQLFVRVLCYIIDQDSDHGLSIP